MTRNALTLPAPVIERLNLSDKPVRGFSCLSEGRVLAEERRQHLEVRATSDTLGLHGYAAVTDRPYEMYGGPDKGGWNETIAFGFAKKALAERDDIRLLINHDGLPLARTSSGTLQVAEDYNGLMAEAVDLDLANPKVQELRSVLERGDADQMSFAFRVTRQDWNDDYTERTIREAQLFDVSVVTYPANPATVVGLRATSVADDHTEDGPRPAHPGPHIDENDDEMCDLCGSPMPVDEPDDVEELGAVFPLTLARAQLDIIRFRVAV